jgi:hypothetical protein
MGEEMKPFWVGEKKKHLLLILNDLPIKMIVYVLLVSID